MAPALILALLLAGCSGRSGSVGSERESELREVANLLILHSGQHNKGPAKAADLQKYEAGGPLGFQAVKSGDIVIVWGATMPGEGDRTGTTAIVAYEKKTPTEGGLVLLHNGTIQEMTAEGFAAAPKMK
jgi:hypothetical protein